MLYRTGLDLHNSVETAVYFLNDKVKGNYVAKWGQNGVPVSTLNGFERVAPRVKVMDVFITLGTKFAPIVSIRNSPSSVELCNVVFVWDPKIHRIKYKDLTAFLEQAFTSDACLALLPA